MGLVDVDVGDVEGGPARDDPALEEVEDELLVGGAEAEARRPPPRRRGLHLSPDWLVACGRRVVCRVNPMLRLLKAKLSVSAGPAILRGGFLVTSRFFACPRPKTPDGR